MARQFLEMGIKEEKRLSFYNTTYNSSDWEIDTLKTTTLGEMANLSEERLEEFVVEADDEFSGLACVD